MTEPHVIATIPKNNSEEIRVALTIYEGHELIDVRTFVELRGADGERHPTKNGITLARTTLLDLIAALQAAE